MNVPRIDMVQRNERNVSQPFIIVGCLIGNNEGKILLVEEGGKWNQPAGWLELGERLIDGAKREAEEETGEEVSIDSLLGVYALVKHRPGKVLHAIKFVFRARLTGAQVPSREKLPFRWFTPDEIRQLEGKLWDPDLIKEIGDWKRGAGYGLQAVEAHTVVQQDKP